MLCDRPPVTNVLDNSFPGSSGLLPGDLKPQRTQPLPPEPFPLRGGLLTCLSVRPPVHLLYQLTTLHRVGGREQTVPDTNHELTPVSSCVTSSPTAATSVQGVPKPRPPSPAPRLLLLHPHTLFLFHSLTSLVLWTQVCFSGGLYSFFK